MSRLVGSGPPPAIPRASQVAIVVKNLPANAGDRRDAGSVLGPGRSPEQEMPTCSSILAWKSPWTEESGGLQSMGSQRLRHERETEHMYTAASKGNWGNDTRRWNEWRLNNSRTCPQQGRVVVWVDKIAEGTGRDSSQVSSSKDWSQPWLISSKALERAENKFHKQSTLSSWIVTTPKWQPEFRQT